MKSNCIHLNLCELKTSAKISYNYVSRLTTTEGDKNGEPELSTSIDFTSNSFHHVVYTRDSEGIEKTYVIGFMLAEGRRYGDFLLWQDDYHLALANEIQTERPWKGILYLAAIYNRAFSKKKVNQNYSQGFGQIRFTSELDILTLLALIMADLRLSGTRMMGTPPRKARQQTKA